ncbi:ankyrin repeat-containing domain protein, partial [Ochromonadaceae sp. CCMP2298]
PAGRGAWGPAHQHIQVASAAAEALGDPIVRTMHMGPAHQRAAEAVQVSDGGDGSDGSDGAGRTALHIASHFGHPEVVRLLLEKGADAEAKDTAGRTAMHYASVTGHLEVVRLLLEKGADAEAKNQVSAVRAVH